MKKKLIYLAGAAMMLFQSCQESMTVNTVEGRRDSSTEIRFSSYLGGMTRASRTTGQSFVSGDRMEVYGIQKASDGSLGKLFNKQVVESNGAEIWTYSPAKYWEKNSSYEFYAIFPYSAANSFNFDSKLFSVSEFTVNDVTDDQVDVMIAQRVTNHQPYNVVNFIFSHILANVNFYVKVSNEFNTTGIDQILVTNFDVTGLYSKGAFAQTGWNSNTFAGTWTPDVESVYDMPKVADVVYNVADSKPKTLISDLLLLPQVMNDDAVIKIAFKLIYSDGSESMYERTVQLKNIVGMKGNQAVTLAQWDPNSRYNYTIAINPSLTEHGGTHLPIANADNDQDDYDNQDPDDPFKPEVNIIEIDTDGDGITDEYWIDEDLDDEPDYPIIWQDIDDDDNLEALPDRDKDGVPDDTDEDGNPDVIWIDTDNDNEVDTELEIPVSKPSDPDLPTDPDDPNYPDEPFIDFDGNENGGYTKPTAWLIEDEDGEYWIDTDNDGKGDIPVEWLDIDGDGKLEGIADMNGDGKITPDDINDNDGKNYKGDDSDYDVILYKTTDDEGNDVWKELEKDAPQPYIPEIKNVIEFSATVTDWEQEYNAAYSD